MIIDERRFMESSKNMMLSKLANTYRSDERLELTKKIEEIDKKIKEIDMKIAAKTVIKTIKKFGVSIEWYGDGRLECFYDGKEVTFKPDEILYKFAREIYRIRDENFENKNFHEIEEYNIVCNQIDKTIIDLIRNKTASGDFFTDTEKDLIDLFHSYTKTKFSIRLENTIRSILENTYLVENFETNQVANISLKNGETGRNFSSILGCYLANSHWIKIIDPYIRNNYQIENVKTVLSLVINPNECRSHLVTMYDKPSQGNNTEDILRNKLDKLSQDFLLRGLFFTYEFSDNIHDRFIITDKWKIQLGRGLDIFYFHDNNLKTYETEITIFPNK